jgi:hypothetical protein
MLTNMQDSSLLAYEQIKSEGKLSHQQQTILSVVKPGNDYSLQELCRLTRLPINVISGRVNDLKKLKVLTLGETRPCSITLRTIHPVKIAEVQIDLLSKAAA